MPHTGKACGGGTSWSDSSWNCSFCGDHQVHSLLSQLLDVMERQGESQLLEGATRRGEERERLMQSCMLVGTPSAG
jgi:hypothetical protein